MSAEKQLVEKQQQDQVLAVIQSLASEGTEQFHSGHIADALRAVDSPIGTWQIRATLTTLEQASLVTHDAQQNLWRLAAGASQVANG